jgi:predicted DNA-binding transcriptional regulator AlpA
VTKAVRQMAPCQDCGHYAIKHHGGGGGKPASGRCVAPIGDDVCDCARFVESENARRQARNWYERAINAASRIDTAHTTPWKVAMVYSLLAIAENLAEVAGRDPIPPPRQDDQPAPRRRGDSDRDLLTAQDVAQMTGLSVHTLSWWRFSGGVGPKHLKLGRRVFYRRDDVEKWLEEAHD